MSLWLWVAVAFLYGIAIGSFLNVVIWRLPRGGSVAKPTWSYCPRCENRLGTLDLFPVFSFLALRRRCRYCRSPISWRYPAIELLTGLLFAAVAWRFGGVPATIFYCLFTAAMICVFFIDLEHFIIPDGLNWFAALIGFAHNATAIYLHEPGQWGTIFGVRMPASIIGALGYSAIIYGIGLASYVVIVAMIDKNKSFFAAFWEYLRDNVLDWILIVAHYLSYVIPPLRRFVEPAPPTEGFTAEEIESDEEAGGMGGGDGKLAAAIGANLYLVAALQSALFAIFIGAIVGIVTIVQQRRKLGGRTAIPFGPAMVIGALVALFFGSDMVAWYVRNFLTFPGSPFSHTPGILW
ncbi:peptidase [Capsulimonas corticalis]|uniref:Peptidase n=1 Tax=Capsulimonas corticalis TaxID=2219043 RepID=A0A402CPR6_9BACT|nr:prepilin peptidase [Capsulimonas corticalis]BDI32973.1 peptidase [Capsulimonas corticalis]